MSHRLFGTDGVRGKAGEYPLDHETVARLGAALVRAMRAGGRAAAAVHRRARHARVRRVDRARARARRASRKARSITSAGVMPTPADRLSSRRAMGFDAGLVISASHNPFEDNGIKVFSGRGEKFTEALEREVEAIVADASWSVPAAGGRAGRAHRRHRRLHRARPAGAAGAAAARPLQDRRSTRANGATTTVAPRLFAELGFDVARARRVARRPQHQPRLRVDASASALRARCVEQACRVGVAFDGDGDRAIFVDAEGRVVDGDAVLLMCARHLKATGGCSGNAVVATVMSNIGLEIALRESGIELRPLRRSATST